MLVLVLGVLLVQMIGGIANDYLDLAKRYQTRVSQARVIALAENIEQYYNEFSELPVDLETLVLTPGFEHGRGLFAPGQGYAHSPVLNDGVWQFTRAVLFHAKRADGTTLQSYLANNECGAGSFDSALSWCGQKNSQWFRRESRERYNDQIATQRLRMTRTLQKMSDHYNVYERFPDRDSLNVALPANSISKLATLVGYAGAGNACSGSFNYMNVPIDCGDMFDLWGKPIGYQFVGPKRVILTSETPIVSSAGTPLVVASEYDYSLL